MPPETALPLQGVRVLDLTHRLAGPTATMLLGDWGAEVIKIEWWQRMDAWRGVISVEHDVDKQEVYNKSLNWLKLNRSKKSLTLNLKEERALSLFLDLVDVSDVVVENFSNGVLDRLGLGWQTLSTRNPRIILAALPGLGTFGPHADFVSNGNTIQGYAGLASLTGHRGGTPRTSINTWPDSVAGVAAATAVAMALVERETTQRGQYLEVAQAEALVSMLGEAVLDYAVNGRVQGPDGNGDVAMAPHGVYPCAGEDEWIAIAVATDAQWRSLCEAADRLDWLDAEPYRHQAARWSHREELDDLVAQWTATEDKWRLAHALQQLGVPATPVVNQSEMQVQEDLPGKDFYQRLDHPYLQVYPGAGARLDGKPIPLVQPPPLLGQHSEEILRDLLGLDGEQAAALRDANVI